MNSRLERKRCRRLEPSDSRSAFDDRIPTSRPPVGQVPFFDALVGAQRQSTLTQFLHANPRRAPALRRVVPRRDESCRSSGQLTHGEE